MTILDTSVVIDKVKSRELIKEDITVVTLVEYPRIIYYKHFYGGTIFPARQDFILTHKLQLELLKIGGPQAFSDLLNGDLVVSDAYK